MLLLCCQIAMPVCRTGMARCWSRRLAHARWWGPRLTAVFLRGFLEVARTCTRTRAAPMHSPCTTQPVGSQVRSPRASLHDSALSLHPCRCHVLLCSVRCVHFVPHTGASPSASASAAPLASPSPSSTAAPLQGMTACQCHLGYRTVAVCRLSVGSDTLLLRLPHKLPLVQGTRGAVTAPFGTMEFMVLFFGRGL